MYLKIAVYYRKRIRENATAGMSYSKCMAGK